MNFIQSLKKAAMDSPLAFTAMRSALGVSKLARRKLSRRRLVVRGNYVAAIPNYRHMFCGYYDHSPFCPTDENLVLVNLTNASILSAPTPKIPICAAVINVDKGVIEEQLGITHAWNWQQGCRPIWFNQASWIYNYFDNDRRTYGSVTGTLGSSERKMLSLPVQEVSSRGKFYSIDYSVLADLRPDYGYFCHSASTSDPGDAGLTEFDETGHHEVCLLKVKDLQEQTEQRHAARISKPKINHVLSSPNGKQLIFMFRYYVGSHRTTDVFHYCLESSEFRPIILDRGVSHYCWMSNEELLFTGQGEEGFGYYRFHVGESKTTCCEVMVDGHPVALNQHSILSDSYANSQGIRQLWQADFEQTPWKRNVICETVEPWYLWGERRCDMHPSISASGKRWQADVVSHGRRKVLIGQF
ncbi:hypothetical protein [Aureliella helgolandensis]|uniref:Uncharacterized protein n=1 Tax=Aureliella helgolandensis TaxID=2527968 RepID=A0A518GC28_9BACT|nr:hypothetical protein [Aureliella helgolandensis]QDV26133.1 hypothetical protein Q31a_45050 [Aureliella helgolandensis]